MIGLGLDIDCTITACPRLFSLMTEAVKQNGGQVHIISGRTDDPEVMRITREELVSWKIRFDAVHLLPDNLQAERTCPHQELDWYQKYLWQKVDYCQRNGIAVVFDDDQKVIDLFLKYAPEIKVFKSCDSLPEAIPDDEVSC